MSYYCFYYYYYYFSIINIVIIIVVIIFIIEVAVMDVVDCAFIVIEFLFKLGTEGVVSMAVV